MSAPQLELCAWHPRDGAVLTLPEFNPHTDVQVCIENRTGLTELVPNTALIVASPDRDGANP